MKDILNTLHNTNRPVVIWGAGSVGERVYSILKKDKICDPVVFCDTYKTGKSSLSGTIILTPNEMKEKYPDAYVCIAVAADKYKTEILSTLNHLGYESNYIVEYNNIAQAILDMHNGKLSWELCEDNYNWQQNYDRLEIIASWLDENDKSLMDIGAGECILKELLPKNVKYIPTDYIKRSPEFILYDFNKDSFPDISADVSVLSGSLMHANDWRSVIISVCKHTKRKIMLDYDISKEGYKISDLTVGRFDETDELVKIAAENGFKLDRQNIMQTEEGIGVNHIQIMFSKVD